MSGMSKYKKGRSLRDTLFGKIRYGKNIETDEWVIIKECAKENIRRKVSIHGHPVAEDVEAEMKIHQYLSSMPDRSPYVLRFLDVVADKDFVYLVLEYCERGDLYTFVQARGMNKGMELVAEAGNISRKEYDAKVYMRQMFEGVAWMHSKGVAHRDLSLENLLLDKNNTIRIIDFGVSKMYDVVDAQGNRDWRTPAGRIGKTGYMSPEVFNGLGYDGTAADIWSCGVICFIMLIGAPPYELASNGDPRFKMIFTERNLLGLATHWGVRKHYSDQSLAFLQGLLLPEDDRFNIEQILNHEWFNGTPTFEGNAR